MVDCLTRVDICSRGHRALKAISSRLPRSRAGRTPSETLAHLLVRGMSIVQKPLELLPNSTAAQQYARCPQTPLLSPPPALNVHLQAGSLPTQSVVLLQVSSAGSPPSLLSSLEVLPETPRSKHLREGSHPRDTHSPLHDRDALHWPIASHTKTVACSSLGHLGHDASPDFSATDLVVP